MYERCSTASIRAIDTYVGAMIIRLAAPLSALLAVWGCAGAGSADVGYPDGTTLHTMAVEGLNRALPAVQAQWSGHGRPAQSSCRTAGSGPTTKTKSLTPEINWPTGPSSSLPIQTVSAEPGTQGCGGQPARDGVDDVGFITVMVGEISASMPAAHHIRRRCCTSTAPPTC